MPVCSVCLYDPYECGNVTGDFKIHVQPAFKGPLIQQVLNVNIRFFFFFMSDKLLDK